MYSVYLLQSVEGSRYYVGSCQNFEQRLKLHNTGRVKSTKSGLPWRLVYSEEYNSRSEAVRRERQIKSWKKDRQSKDY